MHKSHTSRLFYGRYPYKIEMSRKSAIGWSDFNSGWSVSRCEQWLAARQADHRFYTQIRTARNKKNVHVKCSLFLRDKAHFDACLANFKDNIDSIVQPFDDSHVDLLQENTSVEIRTKLLYRRYRYVVTFRRHYMEPIDDLEQWIHANVLQDGQQQAKWEPLGWSPRIYLSDESNLMLIKLTWSERIRNIKIVYTYDELGAKNSTP